MGLKRPTVEVPLLLAFFSYELLGPVGTNLMIYRTCYLILGYNESECALLGHTDSPTIEDLEKKVQPTVNVIDTTKSMVEQVVGLIICLFAGQWSDKFGRKPILLLTQTGMALNLFIMSTLSYFPNINPWYYMFASVPSMLTGGFAAFLVTVLSYISDVSTDETRGMRMAIMEGVLAVGLLCGNLLSSYLFYATNYPSVYAISGGLLVLSILYIIFFVPESLENVDSNVQLKDLFKMTDLQGMFQIFGKSRENFNRAIILMVTAIMTLYIFLSNGEGKSYLFLLAKFNWTLTQYTIYNSVSNILFMVGAIVGTYVLHKLLRVTESVTILLGLMSAMNGALVRGLATKSYHIYFSAFVKFLGGIISPQCRTLVSKLVPADEIAKIFSLIMVVEFVVSIGSSPFYTVIYNATVNTNPGFYNFVSAGLFAVGIILITIIMVLENKTVPSYTEFINEEPSGTPNNVIETF